jgi:hypothetical protein
VKLSHVPIHLAPPIACPCCTRPLSKSSRELLLGTIIGLECCGYVPTAPEAIRWAAMRRFAPTLANVARHLRERGF